MTRKVLILVIALLLSCNKERNDNSVEVSLMEDGSEEITRRDVDGNVISINYQEDGIREGPFFEFYKSGLVRRASIYKEGKKQGEDFLYFDSLKTKNEERVIKVSDLIKGTPSKYSIYHEGKVLYYISFKKNRQVIEEVGSRFIDGNFVDNEVIPCDNRKVAFWQILAYPFVIEMSVKKMHTDPESKQSLKEFYFIHHDDNMYLRDSIDLTKEQEISYIVSFKPDNDSVLLDTLTLYVKCDN